MKIRYKKYYDAFKFDGNVTKLVGFIEKHKCEVLKVEKADIEDIYAIYYIDICGEPQLNEIKKGYICWFDEIGILSYATKEHIKENFEIKKG